MVNEWKRLLHGKNNYAVIFYAAMILGLTGSLHCVGMCSPLAMAVANVTPQAFLNRVLYNSGRITTYGLLGYAAASTEALLPIAGYQSLISILSGILLIVLGLAGIRGLTIPLIGTVAAKFVALLKNSFAALLKRKHFGSLILLGMINGFLPCGLTFMALMVCLTFAAPIDGLVYMLLFGVGTLPVMLGLASIIDPVVKKLNWKVRHVVTVLLIASGCLMIVRAVVSHEGYPSVKGLESGVTICR